jgi:hypothetical protein
LGNLTAAAATSVGFSGKKQLTTFSANSFGICYDPHTRVNVLTFTLLNRSNLHQQLCCIFKGSCRRIDNSYLFSYPTPHRYIHVPRRNSI